jgi:hypothetical protein
VVEEFICGCCFLYALVHLDNVSVLRAISSMDRPFESDGEMPPPSEDAESSTAHIINECTGQHQRQHLYNEHGQGYQDNSQQECNNQPEPESLSVFMRGIRDLAARHRKTGGLASQRLVASRLHAAAISLQVPFDFAPVCLYLAYTHSCLNSVRGGRA